MSAIDIPALRAYTSSPLPLPAAALAAQKFTEAGVIVLKDLLSPDRIATIDKAYAAQFGDLTRQSAATHIKEVGDRRLMVALEVAGAFAAPDIFANPIVLSIVDKLLGGDFILGSYVAVTSMAGAKAQRLHTDQQGLFDDPALDSAVPAYSVTLVIPLVALNPTTGSTQFFPGSHRNWENGDPTGGDGIAPDTDPGDAILFDSRITHGGMANRSKAQRPILYCTYHRAWYRDVSNFRDMPPMIVHRATLDGMAEEHSRLVAWATAEAH